VNAAFKFSLNSQVGNVLGGEENCPGGNVQAKCATLYQAGVLSRYL